MSRVRRGPTILSQRLSRDFIHFGRGCVISLQIRGSSLTQLRPVEGILPVGNSDIAVSSIFYQSCMHRVRSRREFLFFFSQLRMTQARVLGDVSQGAAGREVAEEVAGVLSDLLTPATMSRMLRRT